MLHKDLHDPQLSFGMLHAQVSSSNVRLSELEQPRVINTELFHMKVLNVLLNRFDLRIYTLLLGFICRV